MILTYKARYGCVVGYSGHERGLAPDRGGGGARRQRDRAPLHDRPHDDRPGPRGVAGADGLQRLVRNIRNIEKALGSPEKRIMDGERAVRDRLAKSVVARCDIPGTRITADMLTVKGREAA